MNFQDMETFWKAAETAAEQYELDGRRKLSLLHRSENVTFLLSGEEDGNPCEVMRVARPGYHMAEELEAEIQWLEKLAEESGRQIRTACPIRNRKGKRVSFVPLNGKDYGCVMFEYLKGRAPDPKTDDDAAEDFCKIGEIAARLHLQAMKWQESRKLRRRHWDYEGMLGSDGLFGNWRDCRELNSQEYDCLEWTCHVIKERLERYGKTENNYGLIHSDLRAANLLKHGEQIQVLDFDDCGFGWHLYDLAASLSFIEDDKRVPEWIQSWLEGYEKILPLTERDADEIPTFLMARRIQLLAWITSHDDSDPVKTYYPGFARKTVELAAEYLSGYGI